MRRQVLLTIAVLGVVVSLGGAGVFAASSDRATTGQGRVTSPGLNRAADVVLAQGIKGADCMSAKTSDMVDDLTTPLVTITDLLVEQTVDICLRNVGTRTLNLTIGTLDLLEEELDCTGDEALVDTTCGTGVGELGSRVQLQFASDVACNGSIESDNGDTLSSFDPPFPMKTIGPAQTACVVLRFSATGAVDDELTQSDQVTWRMAFDATAV